MIRLLRLSSFLHFQFSDLLIYANRTTTPSLHFRVHGQMLLKDVTVLDSEPRLGQEHCFNLYDGKKAVLVAAATHAEKLCWMEDIAEAAQVRRCHFIELLRAFHLFLIEF